MHYMHFCANVNTACCSAGSKATNCAAMSAHVYVRMHVMYVSRYQSIYPSFYLSIYLPIYLSNNMHTTPNT